MCRSLPGFFVDFGGFVLLLPFELVLRLPGEHGLGQRLLRRLRALVPVQLGVLEAPGSAVDELPGVGRGLSDAAVGGGVQPFPVQIDRQQHAALALVPDPGEVFAAVVFELGCAEVVELVLQRSGVPAGAQAVPAHLAPLRMRISVLVQVVPAEFLTPGSLRGIVRLVDLPLQLLDLLQLALVVVIRIVGLGGAHVLLLRLRQLLPQIAGNRNTGFA